MAWANVATELARRVSRVAVHTPLVEQYLVGLIYNVHNKYVIDAVVVKVAHTRADGVVGAIEQCRAEATTTIAYQDLVAGATQTPLTRRGASSTSTMSITSKGFSGR